jgi:DNA-binding GntR family transcriptional regulator
MVEAAVRGRRGRSRLIAPELGELDLSSGEAIERQVYRLLRRALMAGVFLPGQSLTGRSIAESLGVSPTPVRDALKRLGADGVIESRSKSAYFVGELSREQYLEVLNLRIRIEGYAAAEAARVATPEDIAQIEAIQARYTATQDVNESVRINFQFHFEIYKLVRSQILIDVVENLWMRIGPSMHLHARGYGLAQVIDNHRRLIEALRNNDSRAAERALQRDLGEAVKAIEVWLRPVRYDNEAAEFPKSALEL